MKQNSAVPERKGQEVRWLVSHPSESGLNTARAVHKYEFDFSLYLHMVLQICSLKNYGFGGCWVEVVVIPAGILTIPPDIHWVFWAETCDR